LNAIAPGHATVFCAPFAFLKPLPTAQRAAIIQPRATPWVSNSKDASGLKGRDMAQIN
jgi:hypothetical protein